MNSRSGRESSKEYTMDELKNMNRRDLTAAGECETRVTLTEKNWSAVVSLLERLCTMLLQIMALLETLLTRPDAENLLGQIERSTQMQLCQWNQTTEQFAQQAEAMSERFASDANALVQGTEKSLRSMENSTENELREMARKTSTQLDEMIDSVKKWMTLLGIVSLLLLVLLGTIFGIVMLRKL